jgi:hypothetical protein
MVIAIILDWDRLTRDERFALHPSFDEPTDERDAVLRRAIAEGAYRAYHIAEGGDVNDLFRLTNIGPRPANYRRMVNGKLYGERSMSVGDIAWDLGRDQVTICADFGWNKLPEDIERAIREKVPKFITASEGASRLPDIDRD